MVKRQASKKGDSVSRIFLLIAPLLLLVSSSPVTGTEWAKKMFTETFHEFGTVARGSKTEHLFEMTNPFKESIHIASVRASCGCSSPTITKDTLGTWEKGGIHVRYNTGTFTGKKGATITVVIDRPYYAEVQLQVKGYIRSDVVVHPGVVQFNSVNEGDPAEQLVTISYAGRNDWHIVDVQSGNTNFEVELDETGRGNGRVDYNLLVRAKDSTPAGYFNDQLVLVTNDLRATQVPLQVEGNVIPGLTVSPASLYLGVVKPGEQVTKTLIVKGRKPFKITKVSCKDGCFEFNPSQEKKPLHLVPVVFTPEKAGKVAQKILIETDLGAGSVAQCIATATIAE